MLFRSSGGRGRGPADVKYIRRRPSGTTPGMNQRSQRSLVGANPGSSFRSSGSSERLRLISRRRSRPSAGTYGIGTRLSLRFHRSGSTTLGHGTGRLFSHRYRAWSSFTVRRRLGLDGPPSPSRAARLCFGIVPGFFGSGSGVDEWGGRRSSGGRRWRRFLFNRTRQNSRSVAAVAALWAIGRRVVRALGPVKLEASPCRCPVVE